ncbi:uncharacterized protein EKO05_0002969 [Ascochyta rabiei]|uniref:Uncharacterized protein n=1 Tax=Didymella rabiei TaxID=5454 RepID=A0A162X7R0_DIDRA|nr:uncharacterized protein EKO05_0002969 [Ascochyta rabiei]KZM19387.1 hypothetical protein ST47_g9481 [Ascochyta rabiei]UPX12421.1 hypothetical protein EKO05_0002969 [Ascochyta rabiei]
MQSTIASAVSNFLTMNLDTVSIRVGEKDISVYKDLLTQVSPYFEKAFNGSFKEADERHITLEGVSEQTFREFLYWIHAQSLQFDTSSTALDHSAILPPDEVARLAASVDETAGAIEEDSDEEDEDYKSDTTSETKHTPAFDEDAFYTRCEAEETYCASPTWAEHSELFCVAMAKLFVFADKYSVHQLRDDILTALIGQCWKWNWFPDEEHLADVVYSDLPGASKFVKFLAGCIACSELSASKGDAARRMQSLRDINPDIAFEVGVTYAEMVQGHQDHDILVDLSRSMPNSCLYHDHSLFDEEQCRKRIADRPHIFTAILVACAKDVRGAS